MSEQEYDVVVIGAGFAGLYATHRARRDGLTVHGFEAGDDVGGTWYWNRYPGARCDVESVDYSFSFDDALQQEWQWSERFATQPEILAYLRHAADRFGLHDLYSFGRRVTAAAYDQQGWTVTVDGGRVVRCRWLVLATGSLSVPNRPAIRGADDFAGEVHLTAEWPHEPVMLDGKRVGIVGTGSSGIQTAPEVARRAAALTVFQRTANYSIPAVSEPLPAAELAEVKVNYTERRVRTRRGLYGSPARDPYPHHPLSVPADERDRVLEQRWTYGGVFFARSFPDQMVDAETNRVVSEFVHRKIAQLVHDPAVAADLTPDDHPIGTKRICTDSGYYAVFNEPHVRLVNLRSDPIVRIEPAGIRTASGLHELDMIIWATGFDAFTGAVRRIDVRGVSSDTSLADYWALDGPVTYLGLVVPGFPNLFILNGPGSSGPLSNMVLCAEQQIDWIYDLIATARSRGATAVSVAEADAQRWTDHVDTVAAGTLFPQARSWYSGANITGGQQRFMPYAGGMGAYVDHCRAEADAGFPTLIFSAVVAG